jgi:MFS family permease
VRWVSVWSLADGFANSFVQLAIFRALQGMDAAMTVPSAVGIISSYYVREEINRALSIFAAAGTVGFCTSLILVASSPRHWADDTFSGSQSS